MKIILKESVYNLGDEGDVVSVKPGYGRNFLIPQGKAVIASPKAVKAAEMRKQAIEAKVQADMEANRELALKLADVTLTFSVKTNEEGKIFGTVTTQQIADALNEKGFEIDRRKISLQEEIKTLGEYVAVISLGGDIKPSVRVWVVKAE